MAASTTSMKCFTVSVVYVIIGKMKMKLHVHVYIHPLEPVFLINLLLSIPQTRTEWTDKFPGCSNLVNIYVGIGVPWLIDTVYNCFLYQDNAAGLSFSLLVFFATSFGCITVLVLRRIVLGAELGGPMLWAWATSAYFMVFWSNHLPYERAKN
ncbi:hypothetical protein BRADI_4g11050v3 [Brachypodium distachyon]|uniref:Uncharacterized protein n=1 Tax=Brachypodium distachyon TaxID=15368 RepID=I1IJM7_BRADI|nr:hypothetical protein BRADI_4g11050v3 [Brachypodium distachyon]